MNIISLPMTSDGPRAKMTSKYSSGQRFGCNGLPISMLMNTCSLIKVSLSHHMNLLIESSFFFAAWKVMKSPHTQYDHLMTMSYDLEPSDDNVPSSIKLMHARALLLSMYSAFSKADSPH